MTMFMDPPVTSGVGALLILTDHAGFGNPGTFGGPIRTPALDRLAAGGLNYKRLPRDGDVQSDAGGVNDRAKPSRSALRHGQRILGAVPRLLGDAAEGPPAIRENLAGNGYSAACFGKWHATPDHMQGPGGRSAVGRTRSASTTSGTSPAASVTTNRSWTPSPRDGSPPNPYMQGLGTVALVGELSGHVFPNLTLM
jgi:arylsulfatase A-like enzyme